VAQYPFGGDDVYWSSSVFSVFYAVAREEMRLLELYDLLFD
jgi:hypothetical protein